MATGPPAVTSSSSSSTSNKRHSIVPPVSHAGPKPPVQLSSSSVTIAESALLTGASAIAIGAESVIHPRARLESLAGRVVLGRRCIVHERAILGAAAAAGTGLGGPPLIGSMGREAVGVQLGDFVTVEVGASVEAGHTLVGDGTVVGVGSSVGRGARVGRYCILTPRSVVAPGDVIPDFTVVYSNGLRRPDQRGLDQMLIAELRNKGQTRQIEVLKRLIPSKPDKFL